MLFTQNINAQTWKEIGFNLPEGDTASSSTQITFPNKDAGWFITYGDTAEDRSDHGYAVLQTEDGGFIAAGDYGQHYIVQPIQLYGDVYIVKTDEYGDTIWTKTYGEPDRSEAAYSMDNATDGGYIISAFIDRPLYHLWILKVDPQGGIPSGQKFFHLATVIVSDKLMTVDLLLQEEKGIHYYLKTTLTYFF